MHLGLDISTKRTGYALLSMNGELIALGDVITTETKRRPDLLARVEHLLTEIESAVSPFGLPEHIAIEEPLDRVRRGQGSAHTIALLHRFNGMASYGLHVRYPEASIRLIAPSEARRLAGQPKRKKSADPKEHALRWASKRVAGTEFALTGAGRFDRADALGLALASFALSKA